MIPFGFYIAFSVEKWRDLFKVNDCIIYLIIFSRCTGVILSARFFFQTFNRTASMVENVSPNQSIFELNDKLCKLKLKVLIRILFFSVFINISDFFFFALNF